MTCLLGLVNEPLRAPACAQDQIYTQATYCCCFQGYLQLSTDTQQPAEDGRIVVLVRAAMLYGHNQGLHESIRPATAAVSLGSCHDQEVRVFELGLTTSKLFEHIASLYRLIDYQQRPCMSVSSGSCGTAGRLKAPRREGACSYSNNLRTQSQHVVCLSNASHTTLVLAPPVYWGGGRGCTCLTFCQTGNSG